VNNNIHNPNIVIFLIDGLRSDLLEEFTRSHTDYFLSKLLKQSTLFNNVINCAPYTLASEVALFTGFYPNVNGVDGWFKTLPYSLDKHIVTFTEILKENDYFNVNIFSTNIRAYIPPYGFDVFQMQNQQYVPDINDLTLFQKAASPKFCFISFDRIHNMAVEAKGERTKKDYLDSLKGVSQDIKNFYNEIDFNNTILAMCSDHGWRLTNDIVYKEFNDEKNTGKYLTDKTIKTFFSIIYPGKIPENQIIDNMIRNIDIMPTLLDLVGLPFDFTQGESRLPLINGKEQSTNKSAFSITGSADTSPWKPNTWSIRTEEWKYVKRSIKQGVLIKRRHNEFILFNLKDDPNETKNCIEDYPAIARDLELELNRHLEQGSKTVINYYKKANFTYEKYLKTRHYPLKIKLKVWLNTLIKYKLKHRLKFQYRRKVRVVKDIIKSLLPKSWIDKLRRVKSICSFYYHNV